MASPASKFANEPTTNAGLNGVLRWISDAEKVQDERRIAKDLRDRLAALAPSLSAVAAGIKKEAARGALFQAQIPQERVEKIVEALRAAVDDVRRVPYTAGVPWGTMASLSSAAYAYLDSCETEREYSLMAAIKAGWEDCAKGHESIRRWIHSARKTGSLASAGPLSAPAMPDMTEAIDNSVKIALDIGTVLLGRPFTDLPSLKAAFDETCPPAKTCPACPACGQTMP